MSVRLSLIAVSPFTAIFLRGNCGWFPAESLCSSKLLTASFAKAFSIHLVKIHLRNTQSYVCFRPSLDSLRHHPFVRRHWPMPPAGVHVQEIIEKAERRSVESFLPYIQAYFHSSTRTSRAGSICCATGGRVPHHHHHCKCKKIVSNASGINAVCIRTSAGLFSPKHRSIIAKRFKLAGTFRKYCNTAGQNQFKVPCCLHRGLQP